VKEIVVKKIVYFIPFLFLVSGIDAKSFIPGLERLKSKVEKAANGPKTSLKDILEKTKNFGSKVFINGKDINDIRAEEDRKEFLSQIKEIESDLKYLYWGKQNKFAEELTLAQDKLLVLKNRLREVYQNVKSPLMTFAKDLAEESEKLDETREKIQKSLGAVKRHSDLVIKYQSLAEVLEKYSVTLNAIIEVTDSL
jgi:hypothetical protein